MLATAMPAMASSSMRPSRSQTWMPSALSRTGYARVGSRVNSEPTASVTRAIIAPGRSGAEGEPIEPALFPEAEPGVHRAAHDRRGQAGGVEALALCDDKAGRRRNG